MCQWQLSVDHLVNPEVLSTEVLAHAYQLPC